MSGGAAAVTEAARRAQRSARGGGRRRPRVNTQRVAPAGGGGAGGPRSLPTGPQGWEPAERQSALARLRRIWQPRLLPGASSRFSPPSEAPSSSAPHLPLATPAASLRAALPQPSKETGGRRCAEPRGARLRGRDRDVAVTHEGTERSGTTHSSHTRDFSTPAVMAVMLGKPRAGCNPCIWARFVFTAPKPRSYVPRLTATTGGCQPWPPLLRQAVP